MSDKIIDINELFSSQSLVTRQVARDLFNLIAQIPENSIILDLSKIDYASGSFFDEFNSYEKKFKLTGKKVKIINLSDNLAPLLKLAKESSKKRIHQSYESVANAKEISI